MDLLAVLTKHTKQKSRRHVIHCTVCARSIGNATGCGVADAVPATAFLMSSPHAASIFPLALAARVRPLRNTVVSAPSRPHPSFGGKYITTCASKWKNESDLACWAGGDGGAVASELDLTCWVGGLWKVRSVSHVQANPKNNYRPLAHTPQDLAKQHHSP